MQREKLIEISKRAFDKEAYESRYWIELLRETKYIDKQIASELIAELDEIIKIQE